MRYAYARLVPKRASPPASKEDITMLMGEIGKLYDANKRWKDEIMQHFDVVAENIRHDALGANRDEVERLKDRVTRLEEVVGTTR